MPIRLIFLGSGLTAEVDIEDADLVGLPWRPKFYKNHVYALRQKWSGGRAGRHKTTLLSREISARMGPIDGLVVDHINGDTLDNRRCNLRAVSRKINRRNTDKIRAGNSSGATGVQFVPRLGKWRAFIMADYRGRALGCFTTKEEAIAARLKAERELWGIEPRRAKAHAA